MVANAGFLQETYVCYDIGVSCKLQGLQVEAAL
jgi:hypothetical protein